MRTAAITSPNIQQGHTMLTAKEKLMSKPSYRHPPLKLTFATAWSGRSGGSALDSRTQHVRASTERNNKKKTKQSQIAEVQQQKALSSGTQQSLRGHVAMKKLSSYTAYPTFLGK